MKVLLFSNLYPSLREPTRGTFHYNLFHALAQHCDTRLIAPLPWWSRVRRPTEWLNAPHETHTGIDAVFPTYWSIPRYTPLHASGMYWSLRRRVANLRREFPFDVILAAWAYPDAVAAAQLAHDFNCPLVTKVLGSDINEIAGHSMLKQQILWALNRSHTIIAVSGALRDRITEMGVPRERVVMHHNGVNGDQFAVQDRKVLRSRLGLSQNRNLLCYVGNLKPEKGVDVLVEAMGRLHGAGRDDVDLILVGGGPLEASLRARTASLGLKERIHFVGRKPHTEIPEWIGACDVFCLPSRREGCPNVVLEGLASGRPVVASAVGGVPELIHSGNGILVPSDDPAALAIGLKDALERNWDPVDLRRSVENLSWDELSLALHTALTTAVAEHKAQSELALA